MLHTTGIKIKALACFCFYLQFVIADETREEEIGLVLTGIISKNTTLPEVKPVSQHTLQHIDEVGKEHAFKGEKALYCDQTEHNSTVVPFHYVKLTV